MQNPQTLIMAMNLARTLEQREQYYAVPTRASSPASGQVTYKAAVRGILPGGPPPLALPAPPSSTLGAPASFTDRPLR